MSSAVPVSPPAGLVNPALDPAAEVGEELRVYGHNNLFYWWPVWALGFLFATLTYVDGHVMAIVPPGTQVEQGAVVPGTDGRPRDVLVTPPGQTVPAGNVKSGDASPHLRVADNNSYGVVFIGAILFVIVATNLTLRGMASVIAIALLIIVFLFLWAMNWWDSVLLWVGGLDVRMNAGGYLAVGIPLCLLWAFSTFVYDHYTYLVVSRGQIRVRQEIGEGELAVDASGLLLEKKRNDVFRHWLLGFGSGDLHVKTGGPSNLDFELPNVLFVGFKIAKIQDMLREKEVTPGVVPGTMPA
jgi:hypothetical protein